MIKANLKLSRSKKALSLHTLAMIECDHQVICNLMLKMILSKLKIPPDKLNQAFPLSNGKQTTKIRD